MERTTEEDVCDEIYAGEIETEEEKEGFHRQGCDSQRTGTSSFKLSIKKKGVSKDDLGQI
jgi:hypothetical protein